MSKTIDIEPVFLEVADVLQPADSIPDPRSEEQAYNIEIIEKICEKVATGESLTKILGRNGLPTYPLFCRWRRKFPEVDLLLQQAKEDRTEFIRDRLESLADEVDEDNASATRVRFDVFRFLMGTENRKVYGKEKGDINISVPTQILVATGIDRGDNKQEEKLIPAVNTEFLPESSEF